MQIRKAASVLPEPVGAEISVVLPARMYGQPSCCGSVGVPKRLTNQSRTTGCAHSRPEVSGNADPGFIFLGLNYSLKIRRPGEPSGDSRVPVRIERIAHDLVVRVVVPQPSRGWPERASKLFSIAH